VWSTQSPEIRRFAPAAERGLLRFDVMRIAISLGLLLVLCVAPGCTTRNVVDTVADSALLQIRLRSQKEIFGETLPRGFGHPAEISASRMQAILSGIEIDTSKSAEAMLRERKQAISPQVIRKVSERLVEAYAKAGPDQEIVVVSLRKQMQHGVFNRKYMTSFVTYIRAEELYVFLSRVEFKIKEHDRSELPADPVAGDRVMSFRSVSNRTYTKVGAQGIKVDWRSSAFGNDLREAGEAPASP
jgi:hypothetical protein